MEEDSRMNKPKRYQSGVVAIPCKHCGEPSTETKPEHMIDTCGDCRETPPLEAQRAFEHAVASTEL